MFHHLVDHPHLPTHPQHTHHQHQRNTPWCSYIISLIILSVIIHSTMGEGKRKAVNSRIQGSAADLMKAAMVGWEMWALQQQWGHVRPVRWGCSVVWVWCCLCSCVAVVVAVCCCCCCCCCVVVVVVVLFPMCMVHCAYNVHICLYLLCTLPHKHILLMQETNTHIHTHTPHAYTHIPST